MYGLYVFTQAHTHTLMYAGTHSRTTHTHTHINTTIPIHIRTHTHTRIFNSEAGAALGAVSHYRELLFGRGSVGKLLVPSEILQEPPQRPAESLITGPPPQRGGEAVLTKAHTPQTR